MSVSLCIATYRRPDRLGLLLYDLTRQSCLPDEVIVVDNDADASARVIVENRIALGTPFAIRYDIQPQKNISLTRNRTVELAQHEWVAFIDDDERAPELWLEQLVNAAKLFSAHGVLGPVIPVVPANAPLWIRRGQFYDFPRLPTGSIVPPNRLRFGNVLLHRSWLHRLEGPFDPAYGLTGGEDGDMLSRLAQQGARIVWCDEAIVHEPVEPVRLTLRWLLRRALSGGQDFARHTLNERYGNLSTWDRTRFFLRATVQAFAATIMTVVSWPWGRHRATYWLIKVAANLGKLSALSNWQYREYG